MSDLLPVSKEPVQASPASLGEVLYAKGAGLAQEQDWAGLVQAVAAGDAAALQALYARAHRVVYTLVLRLTADPAAAEELTLQVFEGVWEGASAYDPDQGSVLSWIMNEARARVLAHLRAAGGAGEREPAADPEHAGTLQAHGQALRAALARLTPYERQALEATYVSGLTHAEAAARLNQPAGTIKTRIRSGLHKLRAILGPAGEG